MARPESVALGGYYPTPPAVTRLVAQLIDTAPTLEKDAQSGYCGRYTLVDPCAGDGQAIVDLAKCWFPDVDSSFSYAYRGPYVSVYGAELEKARAERLGYWPNRQYREIKAVHGDAFRLNWGGVAGAHLLYLNPPYDVDRVHGRLEQRFLTRFTPILQPGAGILVFVVPHYALDASATLLAREYETPHCFRFPADEFATFRQVVLVARRRTRPLDHTLVDGTLVARIEGWARNVSGLPELSPATKPVVAFPPFGKDKIPYWRVETVDVESLYTDAQPWRVGVGDHPHVIHGLGLEANITDIAAHFPVVMPLRPAHVAMALASGLINGREVAPDNPETGLPALLVKGVFVREFESVDERTNKDGEVTHITMIQQPKLTVSILDMEEMAYYDLQSGSEPAEDIPSLGKMNIADLLKHYGKALVHIMQEQCPPLHDPVDVELVLPAMGLRPFAAQRHAIQAALKLLASSKSPFAGENPFALGEVGTGKTLIALGVAHSLSPAHRARIQGQLRAMGLDRPLPTVRRVLVMCPPHLLRSWQVEIAKILPGTAVRILSSVSDVEAGATSGSEDGLTIFLLSREMAKLGHAWEAATAKDGRCPHCGQPVFVAPDDIVKRRLRCTHQGRRPRNEVAQWAVKLARLGLFVMGETGKELTDGRYLRRLAQRAAAMKDEERLAAHHARLIGGSADYWLTPIGRLIGEILAQIETGMTNGQQQWASTMAEHVFHLFLLAPHTGRDTAVAEAAMRLYVASMVDRGSYGGGANVRRTALELLLTATPNCPAQAEGFEAIKEKVRAFPSLSPWYQVQADASRLAAELSDGHSLGQGWCNDLYGTPTGLVYKQSYENQYRLFSAEAALGALGALLEQADFDYSQPCDAPLFTAVPQPRRVSLATYIQKRHPNLFDLLVLDEAHEYAHDGSAQERAAHRLAGMGKPVLPLTGTSNNGYASSLFMNMWALSGRFRREFDRGDLMGFVNRYGYRKVQVEPDESALAYIQEYGRLSDRTAGEHDLKLRRVGEVPGVSPLFVLRHLLPVAVSIHKDDLDIELPPLREIPYELEGDEALLGNYRNLREKLVEAIMQDLRDGNGLAGKLWGQMAQIPTYLDRAHADTGNTDYEDARRYEVRYPVSVGGMLVAAAAPLPVDEMTAKEEWLLETLADELRQKRACLVLAVNTRSGLAQRLSRLIGREIGVKKVSVLDPAKVSAAKRQEWIDRQIERGVTVMITNPKAVETGLNNLVYFSTALWYQNPNCSSIMYTQANGRIHRPGQEADEVRVYVPYYAGTTQQAQHMLLGHKITASRQTDGLDITSALVAAGAADHDAIDAMAVGQAIYHMLVSGHIRRGARVQRATAAPKPPDVPKEVEWRPGIQMRLLERRPAYSV